MSHDEHFMRRALQLAARPGSTSPNPRVGAVVVRDGHIVAEAAHEGAGHPHAEAAALDGVDATGATLYVNLEPCVHEGRMPPCAPQVVAAGIARVVIAHEDPDERVAGRGVAQLRAAGIEVITGVIEDEARTLNTAYIHQRTTGRPFVTVKLALSIDGRLAAPDGSSQWITGEKARREVHMRRREVDAVMVGAGSVTTDDPQLTVRVVPTTRQPARVVVDARGRVEPTAAIFGDGETVIATTDTAPHERQVAWKEAGAEVMVLPSEATGGVDLHQLMMRLGQRGWLEVYCEGGAELATSLLRADLVDRLEIHHGPVLLGAGGPSIGDVGVRSIAQARRWRTVDTYRIGDDVVVRWEREG
jgi:diaminohydroxyphosphoribosylaminopyrimidine deaminase/5-amino-6-(5-phosphoribosylamino)uracil reductase